MSPTTPLLGRPQQEDHPIFLRVCHSPWYSINQQSLTAVRGVIAAYFLFVLGAIVVYEAKFAEHGWMALFYLSNISWLIQTLYALLAFVSTSEVNRTSLTL
jgi:hypothetical protein